MGASRARRVDAGAQVRPTGAGFPAGAPACLPRDASRSLGLGEPGAARNRGLPDMALAAEKRAKRFSTLARHRNGSRRRPQDGTSAWRGNPSMRSRAAGPARGRGSDGSEWSTERKGVRVYHRTRSTGCPLIRQHDPFAAGERAPHGKSGWSARVTNRLIELGIRSRRAARAEPALREACAAASRSARSNGPAPCAGRGTEALQRNERAAALARWRGMQARFQSSRQDFNDMLQFPGYCSRRTTTRKRGMPRRVAARRSEGQDSSTSASARRQLVRRCTSASRHASRRRRGAVADAGIRRARVPAGGATGDLAQSRPGGWSRNSSLVQKLEVDEELDARQHRESRSADHRTQRAGAAPSFFFFFFFFFFFSFFFFF